MLCETCWLMLRGQNRRRWKGTYDLYYNHHATLASLQESAFGGCGICRVLFKDIFPQEDPPPLPADDDDTEQVGDDAPPDNPLPITSASLAIIHNLQDTDEEVYRLDMRVHYEKIFRKRTFVLKPIGQASAPFRTPISDTTSSGEVTKLAMKWIDECKCVSGQTTWHPSRLIDLEALKSEAFTKAWRAQYTGNPGQGESGPIEDLKVHLVEKKDALTAKHLKQTKDRNYVTLSHRWGNPDGVQPLKLTEETLEEFKKGIRLKRLPQTFQDALVFAAQLSNVGYVWIDSLCIIQGSTEDWLHESALMQEVYSKSYLNISATAAENSSQGLYSYRNPKYLWEDEVGLNIEGLPGSIRRTQSLPLPASSTMEAKKVSRATWLSFFLSPFIGSKAKPLPTQATTAAASPAIAKLGAGTGRASTMPLDEPEHIRRCTIVDASLWETLVNQASVNRRGWVLQERLLAPRVLHFCAGQIAWECSEREAAEGLPPGMPNFQTQSDNVYAEIPIKVLDPRTHGAALRSNRLRGHADPDPHLLPAIYSFEIWSRVVETYSRTALSFPGDKLIALSGIAARMSASPGMAGSRYVAGLWDRHLASQLLWRVEPVFHPADGSFSSPSSRPPAYRAPSFSWASLDTDKGHGITCGEVTDRDILVDVESAAATHPPGEANEFGLVAGAQLKLWGLIRRIRLEPLPNGRYQWFLRDRDLPTMATKPDLRAALHREKHTNVYLDCPAADSAAHAILTPPSSDTDIYVLPVSKGERVESDESKYIFCLLLASAEHDPRGCGRGTFRRIGMTKLSPWADKLARENILESSPADIKLPHCGHDYNPKTGKHLICLI